MIVGRLAVRFCRHLDRLEQTGSQSHYVPGHPRIKRSPEEIAEIRRADATTAFYYLGAFVWLVLVGFSALTTWAYHGVVRGAVMAVVLVTPYVFVGYGWFLMKFKHTE